MTKLETIVYFSKAGEALTIQEKINYIKRNSYSYSCPTSDMLRDFRIAVNSLVFYPDSFNAELFSNLKINDK